MACIGTSPPDAPPANATGVQVSTAAQASTLFMPILGFNNIQVRGVAGAHGTPSAPGGPGYGMFAIESGKPKGSKVIDWSGSSWTEFGTIHSNSDIDISGSSNTIGNTSNPSNVEYVTAVNPSGLSGKATLTPSTNNPIQSTVLPDPVNKTLADFYQGTTSTSTYHYIDLGGSNTPADLSAFITNGVLQSGTYYVKGNINLGALSATTPSTVTLVATGSIQSSHPIDLLPFDPSKMLFFADISKASAPGGVGLKISSPSGSWDGIAYAPHSRLEYSGSSSLISKGSIVAFDIKFSGSSGTLKYDPSYFGTPSVAQIFLYQ